MTRRPLLIAGLLLAMTWPVAAEDDAAKIAFNNHCRTCHSFRKDDNRMGPSMHGIFGAEAGRVPGYRNYSGGLTGVVWDEAMLDKFMADPASISTSTNMMSPPVADAAVRSQIIRFLKSISRP
ncbi:MAG: c-type cytochrome [Hyphomicrobium sp.]